MTQKTHKKTVLVIEDDAALLEVITTKLQKSGYNVVVSRSVDRAFATEIKIDDTSTVTKTSIEAALEHLHTLEQVDAIWLDHNLIGAEDGLDFVVKFKANGGTWSKVPIFVVSNSDNRDLVKTYTELGVNHYYIKAEHALVAIIADIGITLQSTSV